MRREAMRSGPGQSRRGLTGPRLRAGALRALVAAILPALFAACRTPPPPLPEADPASALPAEAGLYFALAVPENRDFLRRVAAENGLASRGSDYFLDRSRIVYGAAEFSPEKGSSRLTVAAQGDFSRALVEFGVRRSEGWSEHRLETAVGAIRYYRDPQGREIAVPSDEIILLASGGGVEESLRRLYGLPPAGRTATLPRGFRSRSAAFCFSRPGGNLFPLTAGFLEVIPFQEAEVYADRRDGHFSLDGRAVFAGSREAASAAALLRLFLSGLMIAEGRSPAEIRSSLSVQVSGPEIFFSGLVFSDDSAAALLRRILAEEGPERWNGPAAGGRTILPPPGGGEAKKPAFFFPGRSYVFAKWDTLCPAGGSYSMPKDLRPTGGVKAPDGGDRKTYGISPCSRKPLFFPVEDS